MTTDGRREPDEPEVMPEDQERPWAAVVRRQHEFADRVDARYARLKRRVVVAVAFIAPALVMSLASVGYAFLAHGQDWRWLSVAAQLLIAGGLATLTPVWMQEPLTRPRGPFDYLLLVAHVAGILAMANFILGSVLVITGSRADLDAALSHAAWVLLALSVVCLAIGWRARPWRGTHL